MSVIITRRRYPVFLLVTDDHGDTFQKSKNPPGTVLVPGPGRRGGPTGYRTTPGFFPGGSPDTGPHRFFFVKKMFGQTGPTTRSPFVYYESTKREVKGRLTYEYRWDERLETKNEESTRLTDTGLFILNR
jgi:hypothetical protein